MRWEHRKPVVAILYRRKVVREETIALARHFLESGHYAVAIVCIAKEMAETLPNTIKERVEFVTLDGQPFNPSVLGKRKSKVPETSRNWRDGVKKAMAPWGLFRALILLRGLSVDLARAERLMARLRPAALLVFDDRAPRPEMVVLHKAAEAWVPSVLVPFAASTLESDALSRRDSLDHLVEAGHLRTLKRVFATRLPNQVADGGWGRMFFFGLWETLALACVGLADTNPWAHGGGKVSGVAVFGEADRLALMGLGVPAERIRVTGQPSLDELHRARTEKGSVRATIAEKYALDAEKAWIACAVPHTAEHNLRSWEDHMVETEALFLAMANSGAQVLLSLHPKSRRETYAELAELDGMRIISEPLAAVLPAADIFVSGYSSTVRWAALLGIPTVIADLAQIRYTMYNGLTSAPNVTSAGELTQVLSSLARSPEQRARIGEQLSREAAEIGLLDGGACRSIRSMIDELLERRGRPA